MARLIVITGPMFSWKTDRLKTILDKKIFSGLRTLVIKPNVCVRNVKRDIKANKVQIVSTKEETLDLIRKTRPHFIGIEEGQFFGGWLIEIIDLLMEENVNTDLEIVVVGLDMDSNKKPFGIMPTLMAKADEVIKVTGICSMCKKDANLSYEKKKEDKKLDKEGNNIKAGDFEDYDARCRICHNLPH